MSYKAKIYTLGCKVNQYESEAIAEELEKNGFEIVRGSECGADVCIINTCTVTAESDRKSRQMIRRLISSNPEAAVIVTGCYAQVSGDKIAQIKGVDYICGNKSKMICVQKAMELVKNKNEKAVCEVQELEGAQFEDMSASHSERTRAYIKIEDGCENNCSYCIIPMARGKIRSKAPEKVLEEAKKLKDAGYHELVLTGIEVAAYGKDLQGGIDLGELMVALDQEVGFERISLGSLEPSMMRSSFVDKITALSGISHHFHLSLQSGCNKTLAGMKRKYNTEKVRQNVDYIRSAMPDATFTADIIVGFPGESVEDFDSTCEFIASLDLFDAHVFAYSKRKGTPASELPEQVSEEEKSRRSSALTRLCKEKKSELLKKFATTVKCAPVLFETYEDGVLMGRLNNFIPVKVKSETDLSCSIRNVTIFGCTDEELLGEIAY